MRCSVLNCHENEGGYCMSASYVEIDANGACDLMHAKLGTEEPYSSTQVNPRCKLTVNAVGFGYIHRGLELLEARFGDGRHHDQLIEVQKLKADLCGEYVNYLREVKHEN